MLSHRFYYKLKPYLPWRVRMALRRMSARKKRQKYTNIWPIDPAAGRSPQNWPGWPEGKKFAVALTHDVEGPRGLEKCRRLMEREQQLGFRSCFNFIPEGSYEVPAALRVEIAGNGFEVGVHDLRHDGRLFESREAFEEKAERINRYLQEWGAKGFRSGFMLRNLNWLHQFDIQYDSSTFDTDPFELQSAGAGTIFPYWVSNPSSPVCAQSNANGNNICASRITHSGVGYIELPYTLPQDSTLFLVLRETTPAIWIQKLDWLAEHGGMVLVNVHPDYLQFDGDPVSARTFPISHYIELLTHLRQRYDGAFWQPLPRGLAEFATSIKPRIVPPPKRVCMITHSFYENDNRVTRYAEALAARGDHVDVLALSRAPGLPKKETIQGVNLYRIQNRFGKTERSKAAYAWPWFRLLASSCWWITRNNARQRYDLVHVHNMPDFLVFSAWYPRLTGAKVILDIHDIVPEFYASKFGVRKNSKTEILLKWLERWSARFAHHVIVSNHLWVEKYAARTGAHGKCTVFINNVDNRVFQPVPPTRNDGKLIILFPGGLQWHQGLDIALRAFTKVSREIPNAEFHIYGEGNMKPSLLALARELGFNGNVRFFEPVKVREIARIMANADLGVVPKRADSFGNEAYSTKIMEFMSLGVPVVVSRTKIDQYYFDDSVVRFFESGDSDALAGAMIDVLRDRELRQRMIANAIAYSGRNSWDSRKPEYLQLVDSLSLS